MNEDTLAVAFSEHVSREDVCAQCNRPMLYHVDVENSVQDSFCGNARCGAFLVEITE